MKKLLILLIGACLMFLLSCQSENKNGESLSQTQASSILLEREKINSDEVSILFELEETNDSSFVAVDDFFDTNVLDTEKIDTTNEESYNTPEVFDVDSSFVETNNILDSNEQNTYEINDSILDWYNEEDAMPEDVFEALGELPDAHFTIDAVVLPNGMKYRDFMPMYEKQKELEKTKNKE